MKELFRHQVTVRMTHSDAAGTLFYPRQFELAQECFELLLESRGLKFGQMLSESDFATPVAHAEADYFSPLRVSDKIDVIISLLRIGTSSYTIQYDFFCLSGKKCGQAKTVHVCIDKLSGKPRPIPKCLIDELTA